MARIFCIVVYVVDMPIEMRVNSFFAYWTPHAVENEEWIYIDNDTERTHIFCIGGNIYVQVSNKHSKEKDKNTRVLHAKLIHMKSDCKKP